MYDVAVIGAGIAGMATAARVQARGLTTLVLESHGQPGGCAGFFRRRGFAFDVGATTLVDFETGGVGGSLLSEIGLAALPGEALPGYVAWLPDRTVMLHRDPVSWNIERLRRLGNSSAHVRFWRLLDRLAKVFWKASRAGVKLPLQSPGDLYRALRCLSPSGWPLVRYCRWTMADAIRACGLQDDRPLNGLIAMLLQDTVHAGIDQAPLINGALGVTIRGAGLTRARGGMYGFWRRFVARFRELGGHLRVGCPVERVDRLPPGPDAGFRIVTRRGEERARQVVSSVPVTLTLRLAPSEVRQRLNHYVDRNATAQGGAVAVYLGVPETEVAGQAFTHHQILCDYDGPLGDGNNIFVSVSAPGDTESAPPGYRAVMLSTHCDLASWQGLTEAEYRTRKTALADRLVNLARRVYPELGRNAVVFESATPRTYERFTRRPAGAVGGWQQTLHNSNQQAVPHDIGVPGFWLAGDTTWPGLGTVACVLGSKLVAEGILARARTSPDRSVALRSPHRRAAGPLAEVQP